MFLTSNPRISSNLTIPRDRFQCNNLKTSFPINQDPLKWADAANVALMSILLRTALIFLVLKVFLQAVLLAFNQMDYIAAGKNAYQALFFHRNSEQLNEKDLKVLSDICYTLGQHRQSPAPVVPVTPVHHATDQSYPQNEVCAMQTEHPDLRTFDDTPANSQFYTRSLKSPHLKIQSPDSNSIIKIQPLIDLEPHSVPPLSSTDLVTGPAVLPSAQPLAPDVKNATSVAASLLAWDGYPESASKPQVISSIPIPAQLDLQRIQYHHFA